ncbi:MAG: hypothetical protein M0Q51_06505 [Bacteroidales bacterium]|nr:hypothetical protein [Bacteroidales bacterium]
MKYPPDIPARSKIHLISGGFFSLHIAGQEKKQKKPESISCGYFKAIPHPENGGNGGVINNLSLREPGSIALAY